ncbi:NUDIX domain-containing protein [Pantoea sp. Acro-805]|uniref:8-oxo-dGTP diphosphatase n=1 Tax=Candidatus Pantoea formicae TaxID=2608355 RepID=A0ABX0QS59_9GAMM|nr:NUDIX domain-containing protein [Pantoea formicae]
MAVTADKTIHIAAAIIMDAQHRVLLVRKRDTRYFMQPGGKIEAAEQPINALIRELDEELQIKVSETDTRYIGQFTDTAANEPGFKLVAEIFSVQTSASEISPAAEIEEIVWYHPSSDHDLPLAPLTGKQIIPLVFNAEHDFNMN